MAVPEGPSDELRLELEILEAGLPRRADNARPRATEGTAGLTVLIVDDDADMRAYVKRCVEQHGVQIASVLEAGDGETALVLARATARQARLDLVVSDVVMPRLDGFGLCAALRGDGTLRAVPVLLITGEMSRREAEAQARHVGADAILTKPFNARKLCNKVDHVLRNRSPPAGG